MSETSPPGQTTAYPPPPVPQRLLRRATRDRWLGGVGTGFARYLGIDPVLARIGIVVLGLILWWPILVLYVVCLFVIPADDAPDARNPDHFIDRHGKTLGIVTGVVLLVTLIGNFDNNHGPWHPPWVFFVLLVSAPVLFVVWLIRKDKTPVDPAQPGGSTVGWASTGMSGEHVSATGGTTAWSWTPPRPPYPGASQPVQQPPAPVVPPVPAGGVVPPVMSETAPIPPTPYPAAAYAAAPYAQPDYTWTPRERSALGPLTVGAGLVTAGTLVALDRTDALDIPTVVILGSALAVVGLGLVVGAFFGRSRGLIGLGVVLAIATTLASVIQLPASNSVGDEIWKPLTIAEVAPNYEWGMGEARLDLTALNGATGRASTRVELGVGELKIVIPKDATVNMHGKVGMGAIDILRDDGTKTTFDGISREMDASWTPSEPNRSEGPTIDLDVSVGIGHVEVSRA